MMKYTSLNPDEIRKRVYEEAKREFLEKGITATEMKKLAEAVGIGRTTLYRYFPGLDRLAFMAATEFWDDFFEGVREEDIDQEKTGYENLKEAFHKLLNNVEERPREVLFFSQFDALFVPPDYPDFPEAREYQEHIRRAVGVFKAMAEKGQKDGSVRADKDVSPMMVAIVHAIIGFEQRTALYQDKLRQDGREMKKWLVDTLLEELRKK